MLKFAVILFVSFVVFSISGNVIAAPERQLEQEQVKIVKADQPLLAVMFYSNWCGACLILDPKIEMVKPVFKDRPVDFVKFDFSFALVRGKALQALADEKNLSEIYQNNKGKTGFMLLVNPVSAQVLDVITMNDSANDIAIKLDHYLRRDTPS
ncbi:MAG: thioredoxin domain-containing protein [Robiginitomaculum sp.]|nr:thioredoxin domain-containing protein [Robiginitomaculum sp.]